MYFLRLNSLQEEGWNGTEEMNNLEIVIVSQQHTKSTFFLNSHELVHNGKLYDIKYKIARGDEMVCYCERDSEEENLLSSFDLTMKSTDGKVPSANSKTHLILKLSDFENTYRCDFLRNLRFSNSSLSGIAGVFYNPVFIDSFFIPPEEV